jgi:hypothetical protein
MADRLRKGGVAPGEREQQYWLIEPLVEAGMDLEEIRRLLVRLSFDAVVDPGTVPAGVRGAVTEMIGRMLQQDA